MKKCVTFLTIIVATLLTACSSNTGKSKEEKSNSITFETISRTDTCYLDTTYSESPKYISNISVKVAKSDNKELEAKINNSILYTLFEYENMSMGAAIDTFVSGTFREYYDLRPEYFNEKQINRNPVWLNFAYELKTDVEYGRDNTIIYMIENYTFTGGAHPNTVATYINFNPETGDEIKLGDIFKDNYEEMLNNRLTDALADKIGAKSRKDIMEKGYLTFNDIYPTDNFMLKKDSILFFYNRYDIAPYALGTTTLGFSYEELSDIIK